MRRRRGNSLVRARRPTRRQEPTTDLAHSRSIMSAIALMRLLAYFGRPALSESPLLKELLPISSCAGTRFRSMGVLLYSLCLFSTSFLTATRMLSGKSACATRKPGEEPDRCQIIFQRAKPHAGRVRRLRREGADAQPAARRARR